MNLHRLPILAIALSSLLLGSCATTPPPAVAKKPKLVVFFVVDGLPQRQVTAYRDQLAPDGFARFLDRGAWFPNAHYGYTFTVTAAGHATMLTGAYPHRSGIIGNEWKDIRTGADVYCTGDTTATYIGNPTKPLDGTSPRNLKVETVGDMLRKADPRAKVIAISGKDRGAILPAGHRGTAYMYMSGSGQFASSTYYMKEHPGWVSAFNGAKFADRYFKTEWKSVLPPDAYARSLPDDQPWYGARGGKLPMLMGAPADDKPGPGFYSGLLPSPFADMLSLDFARAAIAGEQLGQDDVPDILSISLSGHDYVNHRYSAESRLSHDHFLHLDRMLQAFFQHLDGAIGRDNYVAMLTADHGFMPAPEASTAQGIPAGKLSGSGTLNRVNADLEKKFGAAKLVKTISALALVLDRDVIAQRSLNFDAVADAARESLAADAAVAAAYTRRELESASRAGAPFFDRMRLSWNRELSGDVQWVLKPYWMMTSSNAATHGSPHPYDTNVPLLVYGPAWVKPGRVDARVEIVDIAPTIARWLQVSAPATAEGKVLPLQ